MEIGDRKKAILSAIVRDYIQTGEPVGSRTIAKKYEVGFSSATIRNEMADLEELGLIKQPHTSAGRIPSDKGYRFYVDKLMEIGSPTKEEIELIKNYIHLSTINEVDKLIKRTAKLISEVTNYTAAIITPSVSKSVIVSLKLIPVNESEIVAVVVTDMAQIKNVMIKLPRPISPDMLLKISSMLNEKLCGLTVEDINLSVISSIQEELKGYNEILNSIIPLLYDSLKTNQQKLYLSGASNIFSHAEYNDVEKAKEFLSLVEDGDMLRKIFIGTENPLEISIGDENDIDEVKKYSIVKATYSINQKPVGSIGVIGPTRMNYSRVMGVLKCFTDILNDVLKTTYED
ncbi:heat-inducible transcriptional repressor HrcA [Clostridium cylindrosporum]|uniref:Heat-inducible transcription repressor HrcA n=1 Tax=Clostridium cylindrosporum DSM 605 TaxID=1121307 RepID=A0A0J8DBF1_CLOCY|nr:heat-inducible transcriptional repressor HrcA [Clostridium cylindrosporum]KMT21639.1 heat-inducible transcription repressor HrcA [Clostridium cylindrosporum DSM 605]